MLQVPACCGNPSRRAAHLAWPVQDSTSVAAFARFLFAVVVWGGKRNSRDDARNSMYEIGNLPNWPNALMLAVKVAQTNQLICPALFIPVGSCVWNVLLTTGKKRIVRALRYLKMINLSGPHRY